MTVPTPPTPPIPPTSPTPFSFEEWEDKLVRLAQHDDVERYVVRLRHWRKGTTTAAEGEVGGVQRVAVYHSEAQRGERPRAIFEVPSDLDLSSLADGAPIEVDGWPEPGGAIAFEVDGRRVLSTSPGDLPMFRVPRFGRSL